MSLYKRFLLRLLRHPFTFAVLAATVLYVDVRFFIGQRFFSVAGSADLNRFFSGFPAASVLAVPALAALLPPAGRDEALPYASHAVVLARMLAVLTVAAGALVLTVPVPCIVQAYGDVEPARVLCGYGGIILHSACTVSAVTALFVAVRHTGIAFICAALAMAVVNGVHQLPLFVSRTGVLTRMAQAVSFAWHFDAAGKGIIDTRDIVFYATCTCACIGGAAALMEARRGLRTAFFKKAVALCSLAAALLLADGALFYARVDATTARRFTLGAYSRELLSELDAPLALTYYRSPALRSLYPQVRDTEDFLRAVTAGRPRITYEAVDPAQSGAAGRLPDYGLEGRELQDAAGSTTTVYSAVALQYKGETEVIPFVLGTDTLEYELARRLDRLVRGTVRAVQVVVGNGMDFQKDYGYVQPWFESQGFTVLRSYLPSQHGEQGKELSFTLLPGVPLVVLGSALFQPEDATALTSFLAGGGRAVIATAPYTVDIQNDWGIVQGGDFLCYEFQSFGFYFTGAIAAEAPGFVLNLLQDGTGNGERVPYALWPALRPQENARSGLPLFWPCALTLDKEVAADSGMTVSPWLTSGKDAWLVPAEEAQTNPFASPTQPQDGEERGERVLAAGIAPAAGQGGTTAIVIGDQYAFCTPMLQFVSAPTALDVRALDFLSDCVLAVSGEGELRALKDRAAGTTALYKKGAAELSAALPGALRAACLPPIALLLLLFLAMQAARRRKNRRLCDAA